MGTELTASAPSSGKVTVVGRECTHGTFAWPDDGDEHQAKHLAALEIHRLDHVGTDETAPAGSVEGPPVECGPHGSIEG